MDFSDQTEKQARLDELAAPYRAERDEFLDDVTYALGPDMRNWAMADGVATPSHGLKIMHDINPYNAALHENYIFEVDDVVAPYPFKESWLDENSGETAPNSVDFRIAKKIGFTSDDDHFIIRRSGDAEKPWHITIKHTSTSQNMTQASPDMAYLATDLGAKNFFSKWMHDHVGPLHDKLMEIHDNTRAMPPEDKELEDEEEEPTPVVTESPHAAPLKRSNVRIWAAAAGVAVISVGLYWITHRDTGSSPGYNPSTDQAASDANLEAVNANLKYINDHRSIIVRSGNCPEQAAIFAPSLTEAERKANCDAAYNTALQMDRITGVIDGKVVNAWQLTTDFKAAAFLYETYQKEEGGVYMMERADHVKFSSDLINVMR